MTIIRNNIYLENDMIELIKLFMSEASAKQNLKKGLGKNPNPEAYDKAVGLVSVMVPFEAMIGLMSPTESRIWKQREFFCSTYQDLFLTFKDSCNVWIEALFKELENQPLIDMTPAPKTRPSIRINDKSNLLEIIEVLYRVRSNLVHGNKTLNSSRNIVLIINSFHLMYNILDHIFREEEIIR